MIPTRTAAEILTAWHAGRHTPATVTPVTVAFPAGAPVVSWRAPVTTDHRVEHRVAYAAVIRADGYLPTVAVRTRCGATVVGPRTAAEVAALTRANGVLRCVRCFDRDRRARGRR